MALPTYPLESSHVAPMNCTDGWEQTSAMRPGCVGASVESSYSASIAAAKASSFAFHTLMNRQQD